MNLAAAEKAFRALGNAKRLKIIRVLVDQSSGRLAASAIAQKLGVPESTLSLHLRVLTEAKLVHWIDNGRSRIYYTKPETMKSLGEFVAKMRIRRRRLV